MIFGEHYGQLAASGEYEVYKSGTTLASFNDAVNGLTKEEFFDSFLMATLFDGSTELLTGIIMNPSNYDTKAYLHLDIVSGLPNIATEYYSYIGNFYILYKDFDSTNKVVIRRYIHTNNGTLTLNSWTLYRRQKSYDIAISGSKAASAIAPVQDSLATANRNYSVGEQFYYDGHLYKVTAAITSGAQIVIGTNAELTDDITTQISKNNLGTAVDISGYTSSNRYTIPSDGYIQICSETLTSGKVQVVIATGGAAIREFMNITNQYQYSSIYVKKGMRCYINAGGMTSGASAKFFPLE